MIDKKFCVSVAFGSCVAMLAPSVLADYEYDGSSDDSAAESAASSSTNDADPDDTSASASGSVSASSSGVSAALAGDTTTAAAGASDHDRFVGNFGIGYMGFRSMLVGDAASGGTTTVEAPVIGARYWFDADMGVDVGLGLSLAGGSTTTEGGGMDTDTDQPEPLAFIVHAGLPLVLAKGRHFVFEIVPEMNVGLASNTVEGAMGDIDESGFHLDLGARAGGEIHFGFMDLPELALQAGVGLRYAMDSVDIESDDASVSISRYTFGTTVGDNPWNIFTANIAALYYFDD